MNINNSNFDYKIYQMNDKTTCHFLAIHTSDPYERGKIYGTVLKIPIVNFYEKAEEICDKIENHVRGIHPQNIDGPSEFIPLHEWTSIEIGKQAIENSNNELIEELRGISDGAEVPFELALRVNAIPIAYAAFMACTAIAGRETEKGQIECVGTDNGSYSPQAVCSFEFEGRESRRSEIIEKEFQRTRSPYLALNRVRESTIRSKVFHPENQCVDIAMGAQLSSYLRFDAKMLFEGDSHQPQPIDIEKHSVKGTYSLGHNLDFDLEVVNHQLIFVREHPNGMKTVSISFPGMLGITEGMNSEGLSLSVLTHVGTDNPPTEFGEHNHFTFYELLSKSKTAQEFIEELKERCLAAPMNLVVCDEKAAYSLEWTKRDPEKTGWDFHRILENIIG